MRRLTKFTAIIFVFVFVLFLFFSLMTVPDDRISFSVSLRKYFQDKGAYTVPSSHPEMEELTRMVYHRKLFRKCSLKGVSWRETSKKYFARDSLTVRNST